MTHAKVYYFFLFIPLFALDLIVDPIKGAIAMEEVEDEENTYKSPLENELLKTFEKFAYNVSVISDDRTDSIHELKKNTIREMDVFLASVSQGSVDQFQSLCYFFDNTLMYNLIDSLPKQIKNFYPHLYALIKKLKRLCDSDDDPVMGSNVKDKVSCFLINRCANELNEMEDTFIPKITIDNVHSHLKESIIDELEFSFIPNQEVHAEFKALKLEDFIQTEFDGACCLYSFLWGIHQNDVLNERLLSAIQKDGHGNYYFKYLDGSHNALQVPAQYVSSSSEEISHWHPSKSPLLRAIGIYVRARMASASDASDLVAYQLYDYTEQGDYVLGGKVRVYTINGLDGGDKVYLQGNGDILVDWEDRKEFLGATVVARKKAIIKGDCVLSVSATKHARSIYYNDRDKEWYYFDNEVDKTKTLDKSLQLYYNRENLTDEFKFVRLFGLFQETPLK